jgi:hypothetical protein
MVYDAVSCAALYLVSAALLGFAFGQPLPLLSVAVWIVAMHAVSTFVQWSTRDRVLQYLGSFGLGLPFVLLIVYRTDWSPLRVEISLAENALMAGLALVAFGLTVAGVSRQRRGDPPVVMPWIAGLAVYLPAWRAERFWFACPTSSATRAQVWYELRSSGLLVLAIGGVLAIAIPLLFLVTTHLDVLLSAFSGRPVHSRAAAVAVAMFALPGVLLLGGNAFGIRARQGRRYANPPGRQNHDHAWRHRPPAGHDDIRGLPRDRRRTCAVPLGRDERADGSHGARNRQRREGRGTGRGYVHRRREESAEESAMINQWMGVGLFTAGVVIGMAAASRGQESVVSAQTGWQCRSWALEEKESPDAIGSWLGSSARVEIAAAGLAVAGRYALVACKQ